MNLIFRKILSFNKIRNYFCIIRIFYYCIIRKKIKNFENVSSHTWKNTLNSNKRAVYDKDIDLPKHPSRKKIFNIARNQDGSKLDLLLEAVKIKFDKKNFRNLKILSIGPRSEGEIFNLFANGFELKNITGLDLFTYSPFIKLGDMHNLEFNDREFDIVLMGWCLAYSNNKKKALSEAKRVLRNNGVLIIGHTLIDTSDKDVLKSRGYLVASPFEKISSKDEMEKLTSIVGLKSFYTEIFEKKLIHGANK